MEFNYNQDKFNENCTIKSKSGETLKVVWLPSLINFIIEDYDVKENIVVRFRDCSHVFTFGKVDALIGDYRGLDTDKITGWAIAFGDGNSINIGSGWAICLGKGQARALNKYLDIKKIESERMLGTDSERMLGMDMDKIIIRKINILFDLYTVETTLTLLQIESSIEKATDRKLESSTVTYYMNVHFTTSPQNNSHKTLEGIAFTKSGFLGSAFT